MTLDPASTGEPSAKRQRCQPHYAGYAGYVAPDVSTAVDFETLLDSLDGLLREEKWMWEASYDKLGSRLPLRVRTGSSVSRQSLAAIVGSRCQDEHASSELQSVDAPDFVLASGITLHESPGKGRGWFAGADMLAGTVLLVERPVVGILDQEWHDRAWASEGGADTAALSLRLAERFSPTLQGALSQFHPQEVEGEHQEAELHAEAVAAWNALELNASAKVRLLSVVRLNSMGFYTNSEQLCHNDNFLALTGAGLFPLGCAFNHSCSPNVSRFSVGDITVFVLNQEVLAGQELCISYIESDLLSAPASLRSQALNRDFSCSCTICEKEHAEGENGEGGKFLQIDAQLQAELNLLPADERAKAVDDILSGDVAVGTEDAEDDELGTVARDEHDKVLVTGKDAQQLRVIKALALMRMRRYVDALVVWRALAAFACSKCPPYDEAGVVYATEAALCSLAACAGQLDDCAIGVAKSYISVAVAVHRVAFGPLPFERRYSMEVAESDVDEDSKNMFWKLLAEMPKQNACLSWSECVQRWNFKGDELP